LELPFTKASFQLPNGIRYQSRFLASQLGLQFRFREFWILACYRCHSSFPGGAPQGHVHRRHPGLKFLGDCLEHFGFITTESNLILKSW